MEDRIIEYYPYGSRYLLRKCDWGMIQKVGRTFSDNGNGYIGYRWVYKPYYSLGSSACRWELIGALSNQPQEMKNSQRQQIDISMSKLRKQVQISMPSQKPRRFLAENAEGVIIVIFSRC